jgi:hypothetical protein
LGGIKAHGWDPYEPVQVGSDARQHLVDGSPQVVTHGRQH